MIKYENYNTECYNTIKEKNYKLMVVSAYRIEIRQTRRGFYDAILLHDNTVTRYLDLLMSGQRIFCVRDLRVFVVFQYC